MSLTASIVTVCKHIPRPGFWVFCLRRMMVAFDAHMADQQNMAGLVVGDGAAISPESRIFCREVQKGARVILGAQSYIGRRVELGADPCHTIVIGDSTTINDNTHILGDVEIGRHCLLSSNIFISSGDHQTRLRPTWLIREQDTLAAADPSIAKSRPVRISEDVWIGWAAVIKRGLYIGRGAVIGSNAVVTHDVAPYSIHGGVPSRELSKRIEFDPPALLDSAIDEHLPYFYAGFLQARDELKLSRQEQVIWATARATLVLRAGRTPISLRIRGKIPPGVPFRVLRVACNGMRAGEYRLNGPTFEVAIRVPGFDPATDNRPSVLRAYHVFELDVETEIGDTRNGYIAFGISTACLNETSGAASEDPSLLAAIPA